MLSFTAWLQVLTVTHIALLIQSRHTERAGNELSISFFDKFIEYIGRLFVLGFMKKWALFSSGFNIKEHASAISKRELHTENFLRVKHVQ